MSNMRSLLTGLLFLFVFIAAPLPAADDDEMTKLKVHVVNIDEQPVDRASVRVQFVKGRSIRKFGKKVIKSWQLKTNQDGIADVPPLPQGEILVQVMAPHHQTYGQVHLIEKPTETIEITLNPPQQQHSVHTDEADAEENAQEKK